MEGVYLDTDCILAVVKRTDWLKSSVHKKIHDEKSLMTSASTVVEARLVFFRDASFEDLVGIESVLKEYKITLLPLDENVIELSNKLMRKYDFLRVFDAIHAATAQLYGLRIMSTDHSFPRIKGLKVENPRYG